MNWLIDWQVVQVLKNRWVLLILRTPRVPKRKHNNSGRIHDPRNIDLHLTILGGSASRMPPPELQGVQMAKGIKSVHVITDNAKQKPEFGTKRKVVTNSLEVEVGHLF
jgi:hypothetical protein